MALAIYRANFHAQDTSTHSQPNSVQFGADDGSSDANANAFATAMAAIGGGKLTTITKRIASDFETPPYPTGTVNTANMLMKDAYGGANRVRLRNCLAATTEADLAALLGVPPAGYSGSVVAMSAAATLPNTGNLATLVNATNLARY